MQSPFPGMDPFIESYKWSTFHVNMITGIQRWLIQRLPEGYIIEVEEGVNANDIILGRNERYRPDASIFEQPIDKHRGHQTSIETITPPFEIVEFEEVKQRTLTIRDQYDQNLITAIEVLSPTNKNGEGLSAYRQKRRRFIDQGVNLVEIDLLRSGQPPYTRPNWTETSYRIQSINAATRKLSFWPVAIDERLPKVAVPLHVKDRDLVLDLQAVFDDTYQFTSYSRTIEYDVEKLNPKPTRSERSKIETVLA